VRVRDEAAQISGQIAELRHAIHREPEIGLDLPQTQRKVLAEIAKLSDRLVVMSDHAVQ